MRAKLAVQMFTLREFTKTPAELERTFERIAGIGYSAVQLSAVGCMDGDRPDVSPEAAREMLDRHGLRCVATHRPWDALVADPDREIAFHRILGCDYVAIGCLPAALRKRGEAGYREFLRQSVPVLDRLAAAGITFGYHNHSHEFARFGPDRRTFYDLLIEESDARFTFEVDTYWVQHAGASPERLIERLAGRIPVVHLKDMEVLPEEGLVMAPVGEGNLDWTHILPACEAGGVRWYAVEQDVCRRDPFDCLRSSFDFLVNAFEHTDSR